MALNEGLIFKERLDSYPYRLVKMIILDVRNLYHIVSCCIISVLTEDALICIFSRMYMQELINTS